MFTTISQYIWGDIEDNGKIREKEGDWVMVDNDKPICWSSSVSHQIICPSYPLTSSSLVHQVEKNNLSDYIECEQFPSLSSHSTTKFTDSVFTTVVLHSKLADRLSSQSSSVSHQVHHSNRSKDVDCLRTSSFLNENSKKPFQKLQSSLSLYVTLLHFPYVTIKIFLSNPHSQYVLLLHYQYVTKTIYLQTNSYHVNLPYHQPSLQV